MSTDHLSKYISNSQRKRDEVAEFNKAYLKKEKVEVKKRSKKASRKAMQILAIMSGLRHT